jgi:hypothetical protein
VPGTFSARPQPLREPGIQELVAWAIEPLDSPVPDLQRAQVQLDGGVQLRLANVSRETVAEASYADPRARGWQRVGAGSCPFCAMLIGRGAVYSERSAHFAAHDHCHCGAVPAFGDQPAPVKPYTPSAAPRVRRRPGAGARLPGRQPRRLSASPPNPPGRNGPDFPQRENA